MEDAQSREEDSPSSSEPQSPMPLRAVYSAMSMVSSGAVAFFWILQILGLAALVIALTIVPAKLEENSMRITLGLARLGGPPAVAYFYALAAFVFISFTVLAWRDGPGVQRTLRQTMAGEGLHAPAGGNGFYLIAELFLAVLLVDILWEMVLWSFGTGITLPSGLAEASMWELMFRLAEASVIEEFISRVLLIGVPLYVIHRASGETRGRGILSYLWGGGHDNTPVVALLIFFSALVFGYLHLGWQWTKVPPTIVSGFAFGYLYTRKGLHAAVLFHFAFDYLNILPGYLGYPAWYDLLFTLLLFCLFVPGAFLLFVHSRRIFEYIRREARPDARERWGPASVQATGAILFTAGVGFMLMGASYAFDDGSLVSDDDVMAEGYYHLAPGEFEAVPLDWMEQGEYLSVEVTGLTGGGLSVLLVSDEAYTRLDPQGVNGTGGYLHDGTDAPVSASAWVDEGPVTDVTFGKEEDGDRIHAGGHHVVLHNNGTSPLRFGLEVTVRERVPDDRAGDSADEALFIYFACTLSSGIVILVSGMATMVAGGRFGGRRRGRRRTEPGDAGLPGRRDGP